MTVLPFQRSTIASRRSIAFGTEPIIIESNENLYRPVRGSKKGSATDLALCVASAPCATGPCWNRAYPAFSRPSCATHVVCDSRQRAPSTPPHCALSENHWRSKASSVRVRTGTYKYRANDEDTGRPFYYDSRSKNTFYVRELSACIVGRHPGQPPFV